MPRYNSRGFFCQATPLKSPSVHKEIGGHKCISNDVTIALEMTFRRWWHAHALVGSQAGIRRFGRL